MKDFYVRAEGIKLFARELGSGDQPPLVIVHGGPDWDHSYLLPAARRLAQRRRVVLFDLRGCGRSAPAPSLEAYSREAAARDILAIAHTLGGPLHLLGFSFGGRLALRAAQLQPERFRSLILASTTLRTSVDWNPEPSERRRRREQVPAPQDLLSRPGEDGPAQTRQLALASLPLDVYNLADLPRIRPIIERITFSGEWGRAWRAGLLDDAPRDDTPWLRQSAPPALILDGQHDFRFPVGDIAEFAELPHVRRVIVPDAGHLTHLEKTQPWCDALADFLTGVEASGST